jgi:probable phosphoglycerate mutase
MLNIYITRHGQDKDNFIGILNGHRDQPLTDKGREQAREVGNKIKELKIIFDAIYTSPLKRTLETARIVSEINNAPLPQKEDLLIERNLGTMTGKKIADIESLCSPDIIKTETITYFLHPEKGESFPDVMQRTRILLNAIQKKHTSGNILLVCHGDVGKMIYATYYNLDWKTVLKQFHFGNCDLLLLAQNSPAEDSHVFKIGQYNH